MSSTYQKFAGMCGIIAGFAGLLYLALFIALKNPAALLPALALLVVGVFSSALMVGLYQQVRGFDEGFALWSLLLGVGGALGASVHAAFDLSNNLHPPSAPFAYANPVDPRGWLTFAVTGIAIAVFSWLVLRSGSLPRAAGLLGIVSAVLLVLLYLAYLFILNATNPVVLLLVMLSGILQPVWYLWVGWLLVKGEPLARVRERGTRAGGV